MKTGRNRKTEHFFLYRDCCPENDYNVFFFHFFFHSKHFNLMPYTSISLMPNQFQHITQNSLSNPNNFLTFFFKTKSNPFPSQLISKSTSFNLKYHQFNIHTRKVKTLDMKNIKPKQFTYFIFSKPNLIHFFLN